MSVGQNIAQRFIDALAQREASVEDRGGGFSWKHETNQVSVEIDVQDFDKYSLVLREIVVSVPQGDTAADLTSVLQMQAEKLINQVDYLTERLALIEVDEVQHIAQLRSQKPLRSAQGIEYFEVLLRQGVSLVIQRFRKPVGPTARQKLDFVLNREVMTRLLDDCVASLQTNANQKSE